VLEGPAVGTDITQTLPAGDPAKGEALANSQGCAGCHISTNSGPAWLATGSDPGIGTRAATRFGQPDYTGQATTAEQYLLESIVQPAAFLLPGYAVQMPNNYGETLTAQDAADLIAYLLTLK
jgi:nitric oxide reductase subunit C